jgi:hypothetical protein
VVHRPPAPRQRPETRTNRLTRTWGHPPGARTCPSGATRRTPPSLFGRVVRCLPAPNRISVSELALQLGRDGRPRSDLRSRTSSSLERQQLRRLFRRRLSMLAETQKTSGRAWCHHFDDLGEFDGFLGEWGDDVSGHEGSQHLPCVRCATRLALMDVRRPTVQEDDSPSARIMSGCRHRVCFDPDGM